MFRGRSILLSRSFPVQCPHERTDTEPSEVDHLCNDLDQAGVRTENVIRCNWQPSFSIASGQYTDIVKLDSKITSSTSQEKQERGEKVLLR